MILEKRINAFIALGEQLANMTADEMEEACWRGQSHNGWFTEDSIKRAFKGLIAYLQPEALRGLISEYDFSEKEENPKTVGVVMAGNIPMVGVHDFICVLLSGHKIQAKPSSQDPYLIKEVVAKRLIEIEPQFAAFISFEERMNHVDALIATGSDNSARYFHHYFKDKPHIIRKNRTGVAVLTGKETKEELQGLAEDITAYFGLGCRNISKIFSPKGYDFTELLYTLETYGQKNLDASHKYANNYDYNKSIFLVNRVAHLDNGSVMLRESKDLVSPISVLHYETYDSLVALEGTLLANEEKIQCVVGHQGVVARAIPFGQAQHPSISDYADGVDTLEFLASLSRRK